MRGIRRFKIRISAPEELLHRILYRRNEAGVPVHGYARRRRMQTGLVSAESMTDDPGRGRVLYGLRLRLHRDAVVKFVFTVVVWEILSRTRRSSSVHCCFIGCSLRLHSPAGPSITSMVTTIR